MDAAAHPFAADRYVLRVGVATRAKPASERKPSHLVFLVDVSGSMDEPDKLPLAKQALHILTDNLGAKDSVSLVTYAGATRLVLPMTSIDDKARIHQAIDSLSANGSTAMASGIDLAYDQATKWLRRGEISRVIVCTDGDANVGPHSTQELLSLIESRAKQGVALSTIGFGMGNYKDSMMEQLADKGNGNNYYIDSIDMAKRVFADQLTSTLEVAAKDVKLQVDFDPALVTHYRLDRLREPRPRGQGLPQGRRRPPARSAGATRSPRCTRSSSPMPARRSRSASCASATSSPRPTTPSRMRSRCRRRPRRSPPPPQPPVRVRGRRVRRRAARRCRVVALRHPRARAGRRGR